MAFGDSFRDIKAITAEGGGTVGVFYSYREADPNIDYTTISYEYTDGTSPADEVTGCRAAATQAILNNFPAWMEMREKHDSKGQDLVHSWGCHLEDATTRYLDVRKDQFISTADQYNDINFAVAELSFQEQRVYKADFRNLLFNSSFGLEAANRYQRPEGWSLARQSIDAVQFHKDESIWGSHSIRLNGTFGHAVMTQSRGLTVGSGKLNASIYVRSLGVASTVSTTERYEADTAGIVLVVKYANFTAKSFGVGFPKNTQDKWVRASFSVTVESEVSEFEFIIVNRTDVEYLVDLPQLELNSRATSWTHSIADVPPHSASAIRAVGAVQVLLGTPSEQVVRKVELFPLSSEDEFKEVRVPTRIDLFSPGEPALSTFNVSWGRQINYFKEVMPTIWIAVNDRLQEKSATSEDRFGDHLPADLYLAEDGTRFIDKTAIDNSTTLVKAATIYRGWIYVVTKETYSGKTNYFLKFLKPDKINYEDAFLQSWGDLELPLDLGSSFGDISIAEEVIRVGICKNIPEAVFIDTDLDRRFYFKLRYDYFFADFATRRIFCRENYTAQNGLLQIT